MIALLCARLLPIRHWQSVTANLLHPCKIEAWALVVPILFAGTILSIQESRSLAILERLRDLQLISSISCSGLYPFWLVTNRSITDTLGPIKIASVTWAKIEIFVWFGAVSNTWNRWSTQSSIWTLVFTPPAVEEGVNLFNHLCESKSFGVNGASAWTECLHGRPVVIRN